MKNVFKLKLFSTLEQFKYIAIGLLILVSSSPILAQNCTGECHEEAEYYLEVTTKLPYAKEATPVTVGIIDGIAYYEGDIMLGKISDILEKGVGKDSGLWPNSTIPYFVNPGFSSAEITKINDAVATLVANTNLCIIPRTTETNYVNIVTATGCSSYVGMIGGPQDLRLASGCSFGSTMHEFLHASGIYHEQSREDRNSFVTINLANITPGKEGNFSQRITNATDYGSYDYGSIMHYGTHFFSSNGLPTITTIPAGIPIGQRTALSAGDIFTVNARYPTVCGGGGGNCPDDETVTTTYNNGANIDIETNISITANNEINSGAVVDYDAGDIVLLTTGFHAKAGSTFHAFIDGCNGAMMGGGQGNVPNSEEHALESDDETVVPADFNLTNYPNPFTGQTTIQYHLPNDSAVKLVVTDLTGDVVEVLVDGQEKIKGIHKITLDGSQYPAGIYYYTLQAGTYRTTQKMILMK